MLHLTFALFVFSSLGAYWKACHSALSAITGGRIPPPHFCTPDPLPTDTSKVDALLAGAMGEPGEWEASAREARADAGDPKRLEIGPAQRALDWRLEALKNRGPK
jgi:hypothetical protein